MRQFNVSVLVGLQDRLSGGLAGLRQRLQAFTRLGDRLGLNRIGSAIGGVIKQAGILGAAFSTAFAAAGGAAMAFAQQIANAADAAVKAAARVGTSMETWQELLYGASLSDLSEGSLERALSTLNQMAVDNDEMFRKLAVSRVDANGAIRDSAEILKDLADVFAALPDGAEKSALATKIFGDRLGRELIPFLNEGRSGMQAMGEEARRFGVVLSDEIGQASVEWNDSTTRLQAVFQGLRNEIFGPLIPAFNELTIAFREFILENKAPIVEALTTALRGMMDVVPTIATGMRDFSAAVAPVIETILALVDQVGGIQTIGIALAAVFSAKLIGAVIGLGAALLTTPIGWFALGAALIYSEWDRLGPFFESLFGDLKALFSGDFEALGRMAETFGGLFAEVWAIIREGFDAFVAYFDLGDLVASASASLSSFASSAGSSITDGLASAGEAVMSGLSSLIDGIVAAWWEFDWRSLGRVLMQGIIAGIAGASMLVFEALANVDWSMLGSAIIDGIVFAFKALDATVFAIGEIAAALAFAVGEVFAGMIDEFVDLGAKLMGAVFDGIKAGFQVVLDWFAGIPGAIASAIGSIQIPWPEPPGWVKWLLGMPDAPVARSQEAAAASIDPARLQAASGALPIARYDLDPIAADPALAATRAFQAQASSRGASGAASDPRPEANEVELDVGGTIRIHVDGPGRVTSAESTTPGVTMAPDRGQSASRP